MMVGFAAVDFGGAVELLEHDRSRPFMQKCQFGKRPNEAGSFAHRGRDAEGSTDDQRELRGAGLFQRCDTLCEIHAPQFGAVTIDKPDWRLGDAIEDTFTLLARCDCSI